MPGGCKFGKSCKYIHCEGKERKTEAENADLNFLGLPLRPVSLISFMQGSIQAHYFAVL
jgi:hypothetical protein